MRFSDLPEVSEAKALISTKDLSKLSSHQSKSRYIRITLLWLVKGTVLFFIAPRVSAFFWPFLCLVSIAIVEGFRNWSHESLHQSIFCRKKFPNLILTNLFLSLPIITPFNTRQFIHLSHHRQLSQDSDEERFAWKWADGSKTRGKLIIELIASLTSLRFFQTALAARKSKRSVSGQQWKELLIIVAYFFCITMSLIFADLFLEYAILWILPQIVISPFINRVRSFAEHGGESVVISRTTIPRWLERLFMYQVHFGYHFEHHVWPGLPENSLPTAHKILEIDGFWDRHPQLVQQSGLYSVFRRFSSVKILEH